MSAKTYGDLLLGFNRQYTYDDRGNIASESFGLNVYRYEYDEQNQLKKVKNGSDTELYSYTYDTAGNIRSKKVGEGEPIEYTYGDAQWRDLLTKYDGQTITYDNSGNPTHYYNVSDYTFTWQQGRQLATAAGLGEYLSFPPFLFSPRKKMRAYHMK